MNVKRITRILMCVFLPTFFAVLNVYITDTIARGDIGEILSWEYIGACIHDIMLFGCLVGVPVSVAYVILECFFSQKIKPFSWLVIFLSAGAGLIAVSTTLMVLFENPKNVAVNFSDKIVIILVNMIFMVPFCVGMGFVVILQMGLLLKLLDHLLPDKPPLTVNGR